MDSSSSLIADDIVGELGSENVDYSLQCWFTFTAKAFAGGKGRTFGVVLPVVAEQFVDHGQSARANSWDARNLCKLAECIFLGPAKRSRNTRLQLTAEFESGADHPWAVTQRD